MKPKLLISLLGLIPDLCLAQEVAEPKLELSGYADAYYAYSFNQPVGQTRPYVTQAVRHNEFNLNWLFLKGTYDDDKVRGSIGLQTGTYVQANYAAEPNDLTRMLYDTYAGVKLKDGIWLDAGVFGGHTGYESPLSIENEVFSRAIATEVTPYYQTGVRLTADLSDQLTLTAVVLNGWQIIAETNKQKSFGINLTYAVNDRWTLNYGNLFGDEGNAIVGDKIRFYNHFYTHYQISDPFHIMVSLDHGIQEEWDGEENVNFFFATLIAGYQVSETFDIGLRLESISDPDQILISTPEDQGFENFIGSVSLNYRPQPNVAWRTELRIASGDDAIYLNDAGGFESRSATLMTGLAVKF